MPGYSLFITTVKVTVACGVTVLLTTVRTFPLLVSVHRSFVEISAPLIVRFDATSILFPSHVVLLFHSPPRTVFTHSLTSVVYFKSGIATVFGGEKLVTT